MILDDSLRPRDRARTFRDERVIWIGFVALTGAAFVNYWLYYYAPLPAPTVGEVLHSFVVSAFQSFIPAALVYTWANHLPSTTVVTWVGLFGVDAIVNLWYGQSIQFVFLVLVASAMTQRYGVRRPAPA